jgi:alginate export protein
MARVAFRSIQFLLTLAVFFTAQPAIAQTSTGLPQRIDWSFNLDAGWGTFGFGNSLFDNPKEPVPENLSDQWFEGYVKPALSGTYRLRSSSEIYGMLSVVGERTYGSAPELYGPDVSSFAPEDATIGWRSGTSIGSTENVVDVSVGRTQYQLGHGFLLWDGASEGGSRGGYWTNARKAFQLAAIGRVKPGPHLGEFFYLDKDELDESDSGTRLIGGNYEFTGGEHTTLAATYMKFFADNAVRPGRNGLNVVNVRAYTAPVPRLPDLSFEFEYASERNGEALDANAWTMLGAYELANVTWKPKLSYRYAFFQGDDPTTGANEAFDPLLPGFYDWGTWWQGEIAGEYFLSNSNVISHQFRAHVQPNDAISGGVIFYNFRLDQPQAIAPTVTEKDIALETDFYTDWKLNKNFTASFVLAFANPGTAVEQATGRTASFKYGMVYLGYSF